MVFVFLHELGHALIDLLDLPTVGKEEDVVDEFATWVFLKGAREADPQDAEVGIEALLLAAESWRLLWKGTEAELKRGKALPWWDEHSLDIQRYYNILCLIYGSNPGRSWPLVVRSEMPIERARKCEHEWPQKEKAWERLLAGKYVPEGQPRPPGEWGRFVFLYGEARSEFGRQLEEGMRQTGGFAQIVDALNEVLLLPPGEVPVIGKDCGFANAYWSSSEKKIVLCWEMFRFFLDAYVDELKRTAAGQGGEPPAPPGPAPQPAGLEMGPLGPHLRPGQDGPWSFAAERGAWIARNTSNPGNLWRIRAAGSEVPAGRRRFGVGLEMVADQGTRGAGLALGDQESGGAFYLLRTAQGPLELLREVREGQSVALATLQRWPLASPPTAPSRLELVEDGQAVEILVDGRSVGGLRDPGLGRGPIGIAAWGTGTFTFRGFFLADAAVGRPTPPPALAPAPQPGAAPLPEPTPQPIPPPAPALDLRIAGTWTAWPADAQGRRTTIQLQLLEDGRYLETSWLPTGLVQRVWGRWRTANSRLGLQPEGQDPWQSCGPQGCWPLPLPRPVDLVYRPMAGGALQIGPHLFYRGS